MPIFHISLHQVVMVGVFLTIILMLLATLLFLLCRRKLCAPCPSCPQTPDKPVKQNNHEVAAEKVFTFFFVKILLSHFAKTVHFHFLQLSFYSSLSPFIFTLTLNHFEESSPCKKVGDKTSVCGEEGWDEGEDNTGLYSHRWHRVSIWKSPMSNEEHPNIIYSHTRLSHYAPEFPPKPDLISTGYVPYGSYVRDYPPGPGQHQFPPSDRWVKI